jgi:small subunit ribosomal protein S16
MPVKIRLSRKGRKQAPFYHILIADSRASRDGKFIEKIGTYNPMTKPATIELDRDAAYDWLTKGAQPTDTVRAILRFKGVYYKKHLMRGLKKGALTQEQVDTMLQQWIDAKESKISARFEQTKAEQEAFRKAVSGEIKVKKSPVADAATEEAAEAFRADQPEAVTEEVMSEVAPATDVAVEEPAQEEAPEESAAEESAPQSEEAPEEA